MAELNSNPFCIVSHNDPTIYTTHPYCNKRFPRYCRLMCNVMGGYGTKNSAVTHEAVLKIKLPQSDVVFNTSVLPQVYFSVSSL